MEAHILSMRCQCQSSALLPLKLTLTGLMDFTQLDLILQRVSSRYQVDEQEVLDKWMEKREVRDPEGWRLLEGVPCIAGGLTALLGKSHSQIIVKNS